MESYRGPNDSFSQALREVGDWFTGVLGLPPRRSGSSDHGTPRAGSRVGLPTFNGGGTNDQTDSGTPSTVPRVPTTSILSHKQQASGRSSWASSGASLTCQHLPLLCSLPLEFHHERLPVHLF